MLTAEGLVELTSHRGTRVTQLTVKEVDNLFQVMGALEALSERDGPCPAVILRRHLKNKCEVVKLAVAEGNKSEKSANRRPGGPPPRRGRPASRVNERRVEAPQPVKPR